MARHYSINGFFQQMPNATLDRYFQGRELFGDLNFSAMKEDKPDELFGVWEYLQGGQCNKMDAEFFGDNTLVQGTAHSIITPPNFTSRLSP